MSAVFSDVVKREVLERCQAHCEMCGVPTRVGEFHHRLPRRLGGTRRPIGTVKNCLYLCTKCHRYVHAHPIMSYERGWLLRDTEENLEKVS